MFGADFVFVFNTRSDFRLPCYSHPMECNIPVQERDFYTALASWLHFSESSKDHLFVSPSSGRHLCG